MDKGSDFAVSWLLDKLFNNKVFALSRSAKSYFDSLFYFNYDDTCKLMSCIILIVLVFRSLCIFSSAMYLSVIVKQSEEGSCKIL
jgi:hypothetical protein